ncbi:hypothetical protein VPNG_07516 [Cytospora leucostoma]|uniref:non-specific serine/threonine protein kinase n=1 Tax=Cytospora leucostoma TaxID=1230097 RepID=A0A423WS72_9PEZI|nr:hypothetical protein VPNG_07516 [Cytospora leucostoma]
MGTHQSRQTGHHHTSIQPEAQRSTTSDTTPTGDSQSRARSPARDFQSSGFTAISESDKLEEENHAWYSIKNWYPVRIGEVFQVRYQVITKIGSGTASTSWLSRDLHEHRYVTIKVYAADQRQGERELAALEHINRVVAKKGVWGLVEGKNLFNDNAGGRWKSALPHMARMVSLLGPPPQYMLDSAPAAKKFFDKKGQFKKAQKVVPTPLQAEEAKLDGAEKEDFIRFISRLLQWDPNKRPNARELGSDPWIKSVYETTDSG